MYQLAQPNQIEKQNGLQESRDHFRNNMSSRTGTHANTPSPPTASTAPAARARRSAKGVVFTPSLQVHRYPPAVWGEEEEDDEDVEWDDEGYEGEDRDSGATPRTAALLRDLDDAAVLVGECGGHRPVVRFVKPSPFCGEQASGDLAMRVLHNQLSSKRILRPRFEIDYSC